MSARPIPLEAVTTVYGPPGDLHSPAAVAWRQETYRALLLDVVRVLSTLGHGPSLDAVLRAVDAGIAAAYNQARDDGTVGGDTSSIEVKDGR